MSIGTSFEMAVLKAVRGAEISLNTLNRNAKDGAPIRERLARVDDFRMFTVFEALKAGVSVDEIFEITKIDRWFLYKLRNLAEFEDRLQDGLTQELYEEGKKLGYPDDALCALSGAPSIRVAGIFHRDPVYKMVDTCAAEFAATTPYFYSTYDKHCESRTFQRSGKPTVIYLRERLLSNSSVPGAGPAPVIQGLT